MPKLKSLLAGLALSATVASTNAQQVLKRITQDTDKMIVELFMVRNGEHPSNVIGEGGYDQGQSHYAATEIFYSETTNQNYNPYNGEDLPLPDYPPQSV